MEKCRFFKCKFCGKSFYVPKDIDMVNCPCGQHGYSEEISIKNATHKLSCRHAFNSRSGLDYLMECLILKEMPNNRLKILVFGERYWRGYDHKKRIRYVDKFRVKPRWGAVKQETNVL
ncbi:hypothetical protein ES705_45154 [subsurface metagenome]